MIFSLFLSTFSCVENVIFMAVSHINTITYLFTKFIYTALISLLLYQIMEIIFISLLFYYYYFFRLYNADSWINANMWKNSTLSVWLDFQITQNSNEGEKSEIIIFNEIVSDISGIKIDNLFTHLRRIVVYRCTGHIWIKRFWPRFHVHWRIVSRSNLF